MKAIRGSGGVRSSLGYEFMLTDLQRLLLGIRICTQRSTVHVPIIEHAHQAVCKLLYMSTASPYMCAFLRPDPVLHSPCILYC
jgi:hypothetical protein